MKITTSSLPSEAGLRQQIGVRGMKMPKPLMLKLFLAATFCALSACMQSKDLVAGDNISVDTPIYQIEMGSEKDAAIAEAVVRWQTEPVCSTEKTGVGFNRRAYFLEKCAFTNLQQQTVCNLSPESVEYAFLEGVLVQAMYRFAEADEAAHGACIQEQALAQGYTASSEIVATDTTDTKRVRLINTDTKMSITLGEEREVRIYDTKTAPTVHLLRGWL